MKIIFLDLEGVLITPRYIYYQVEVLNNGKSIIDFSNNFDPDAIDNLKEIIYQSDAYIVLISNRRLSDDNIIRLEKNENLDNNDYEVVIIEQFKKFGLRDRLIGMTKGYTRHDSNEAVDRYVEILKWLENHPNIIVKKYIIIDDDKTDFGPLTSHLIVADSYEGINNETKEKAIQKLKR